MTTKRLILIQRHCVTASVQALYDEGATPYVFCVNVDAVIAALLLGMSWTDYRSGGRASASSRRPRSTSSFTAE